MTEETETQTSQEIESDSQGDTPSFTESDYCLLYTSPSPRDS